MVTRSKDGPPFDEDQSGTPLGPRQWDSIPNVIERLSGASAVLRDMVERHTSMFDQRTATQAEAMRFLASSLSRDVHILDLLYQRQHTQRT